VKEPAQATHHTLPFTYLPKVMVIAIVGIATTWVKSFPAKGGISSRLSPRTVLTGERFDYNKHCCIDFGAYAKVMNLL
jgi:hypothetical protein